MFFKYTPSTIDKRKDSKKFFDEHNLIIIFTFLTLQSLRRKGFAPGNNQILCYKKQINGFTLIPLFKYIFSS